MFKVHDNYVEGKRKEEKECDNLKTKFKNKTLVKEK
jgi:hypothetical protein